MLKKLGKSITIVNALAFTVVILIGGVSIYLTKDILHNAYQIQEESENIAGIDTIHADAYRLVLAIHHFLIESDELYSQEAISLINHIQTKLEAYRAHEVEEEKALFFNKKNLELALLDIMLEDVKGLRDVSSFFEAYSRTGHYDKDEIIGLEQFAYELEETSAKINQIHFSKITGWTDESVYDMWIILILYMVFILLGGLAIYGGHRILLEKVVKPIKGLAVATIEFAEGRLDKRVSTESESEIGQLYDSFNKMAGKLQENDEILRKFNEALERKVRERTSELQFTNDQLQKTQIALIRTEKVAAVGQIAAGVTHEIKNPLNSLSISAQMLLKELAEKFGQNSSSYESAALIRHEINRINNILEEFVKFAKFPEPQFYTNSINSVISEVTALISSNVQDKDVKIELSLQDDIPEFKFDARQFKEVLINLMHNAIKSLINGGKLDIISATSAENVIITVKDTGEGIQEKYIDKIFTPFFSTKEEGLGLGLPIVQRIIESHGGKIECTSTVGEGTVFKISLPMERG
jgi:signal transduction histidine kinase